MCAGRFKLSIDCASRRVTRTQLGVPLCEDRQYDVKPRCILRSCCSSFGGATRQPTAFAPALTTHVRSIPSNFAAVKAFSYVPWARVPGLGMYIPQSTCRSFFWFVGLVGRLQSQSQSRLSSHYHSLQWGVGWTATAPWETLPSWRRLLDFRSDFFVPPRRCTSLKIFFFSCLALRLKADACSAGLALGTHPPTDLGPTHMVTRKSADLNLVVTLPLPNFVSYAAPLQSTN
jgi:hypothetical protein